MLYEIYEEFVDFFEGLGDTAIRCFLWVTIPIWIIPFCVYIKIKK